MVWEGEEGRVEGGVRVWVDIMGYCRHTEIEATAYRERGGFTRASASDVGEVSTQVLIHTIVES